MGSGGIAPLFLISVLDGGKWSTLLRSVVNMVRKISGFVRDSSICRTAVGVSMESEELGCG
jgi:hypothetical protein